MNTQGLEVHVQDQDRQNPHMDWAESWSSMPSSGAIYCCIDGWDNGRHNLFSSMMGHLKGYLFSGRWLWPLIIWVFYFRLFNAISNTQCHPLCFGVLRMDCLHQNLPQNSRTYEEKETGLLWEVEGLENSRETAFSRETNAIQTWLGRGNMNRTYIVLSQMGSKSSEGD